MKNLAIPFLILAFAQYLPAQVNPGLHIEAGMTALFGADTTGAGVKAFWLSSKGAFRAGGVGNFSGFPSDPTNWDADSIGNLSFAAGLGTKASGAFSTAMGDRTTASGYSSTAMGQFTKAASTSSTSMGSSTTASGVHSTSMGWITTASGFASTAMGGGTKACGDRSTSMGSNTTANGFASTSLGRYNDPIVPVQTSIAPTTPLFIIGNGFNESNLSNALVVRNDGRMGVGTNDPTSLVHLRANSSLGVGNLAQILLEETESDFARLRIQNNVANAFWDIAGSSHATNSSAALNFYYDGPSTIGLDVLSLKGDGNATLAGTLTQNSDARLKTRISPLENRSAPLLNLQGYTYQWKNEQMDQSEQIGLLAQEVEQYFPQLVREDENGIKSVHYNGFVPLLIEQIKIQDKRLRENEAAIESLRWELQQMKDQAALAEK